MKQILPFLCICSFFIAISACDKTTIVKGTLLDLHTGKPIDNALITFLIETKKNAAEPEDFNYEDLRSDENGEFVYSHEKPIAFYTVDKIGYLYKGLNFPKLKRGETNEVTINLIPKDGLLKILVNNTGPADTIYVGIYSPLQFAELILSVGLVYRDTFFIENSMQLSKTIPLASEQTVDIHWSQSPLPYDYGKIPSQGSVFITRNDTTSFNISL